LSLLLTGGNNYKHVVAREIDDFLSEIDDPNITGCGLVKCDLINND